METRNPRGAGRPAKPVDPESAHKSEILAWTEVNRRIRRLIEKQLAFLEKQLESVGTGGSPVSMETMLEIMHGLGDLLGVGNKTVESGLKALEKGRPAGADNEDPESVMANLQGGGGAA
jgi:hypothetical protein